MNKMTAKIAFIAIASALTAAATFAFAAEPFRPAGNNFRGFMIRTVAPATQPIWDLGYADKMTDADWTRVQKAAADLVASVKTVASGGPVAAEQARTKTPMWQDFTKKMATEAAAAKAAADKKDQMALATAGDNLLEICGGCHMAYDPTAK